MKNLNQAKATLTSWFHTHENRIVGYVSGSKEVETSEIVEAGMMGPTLWVKTKSDSYYILHCPRWGVWQEQMKDMLNKYGWWNMGLTQYKPLYLQELERLMPGQVTDFRSDKMSSDGKRLIRFRDDMVRKYAWAIPNYEAIKAIKDLDMDVLEVACGNGYWSYELERAGVDVIATDAFKPKDNNFRSSTRPWVPVAYIKGEKVAKKFPNRALLIVWPFFSGPAWDKDTIRNYTKSGGTTIIFVGEDRWGCTGTPKFHNYLSNNYKLVDDICIPQWHGIHDYMNIYRIKDQTSAVVQTQTQGV